jgi:peroxiredoxin
MNIGGSMDLRVGDKAPGFTLIDGDRKPRSLSEFLGKRTVLAFFPGAFTGVCTKEMCTFRDSLSRFNELKAQVVGISVDAPFSNKAFATQNNLQFPILSDYSRSTVKEYGIVLNDFAGLTGYAAAKRSVFVLDEGGVIRYAWVTDNPGVEPNYDEISKALSSIH